MARCRAPASKLRHSRAARNTARRQQPSNQKREIENRLHSVGIIMNGVTGRMGTNQHLRRSILAIMAQGGVKISDGETIIPRPLLVGRNAAKLEALARDSGGLPWTTDLDAAWTIPPTRFISTRRPPTAAPTPFARRSPRANTFIARNRARIVCKLLTSFMNSPKRRA